MEPAHGAHLGRGADNGAAEHFTDCESEHDVASEAESYHSLASTERNDVDGSETHVSGRGEEVAHVRPHVASDMHSSASVGAMNGGETPAGGSSEHGAMASHEAASHAGTTMDCEPVKEGDLVQAEEAKQRGNERYKEKEYEGALEEYKEALRRAPPEAPERAIYHANSGACFWACEEYDMCVQACTEALLIDATYLKALRRRMAAFEKLDQLDKALTDAKQILEASPGDSAARAKVALWEPIVRERQEKMKDEMIGKLKDLGNSVLGRFGMSVDNFKMVQDPNTGGYSISFQQ